MWKTPDCAVTDPSEHRSGSRAGKTREARGDGMGRAIPAAGGYSMAAWAAASLAIGTRNGEQDT
jgi:hypothetical protein